MTSLTNNEWIQINELIKKIYVTDADELLGLATNEISRLIPSRNSMYHYYRNTEGKIIPYNYQSSNIPPEVLQNYKDYENVDYIGWYTDVSVPRVYRNTDLIENTLRINTKFMREWMIPNKLYYSLGSTIAYNNQAYGALSLFKEEKDGDFTDTDIQILEIINEHLSLRFYQCNGRSASKLNSSGTNQITNKYKLTEKELEIINLVKAGHTRDSLPELLFISNNTLKKHLYNIYRKLRISKYEELIQFSFE